MKTEFTDRLTFTNGERFRLRIHTVTGPVDHDATLLHHIITGLHPLNTQGFTFVTDTHPDLIALAMYDLTSDEWRMDECKLEFALLP